MQSASKKICPHLSLDPDPLAPWTPEDIWRPRRSQRPLMLEIPDLRTRPQTAAAAPLVAAAAAAARPKVHVEADLDGDGDGAARQPGVHSKRHLVALLFTR